MQAQQARFLALGTFRQLPPSAGMPSFQVSIQPRARVAFSGRGGPPAQPLSSIAILAATNERHRFSTWAVCHELLHPVALRIDPCAMLSPAKL
jgi:hypothetical protein